MPKHARRSGFITIATLSWFVASGVYARAADNGSVTGTVTAQGLPTNEDVVVSVQAAGLTARPPAAPVEVDQKGLVFLPRVLPVIKGTRIVFLNNDPTMHNVFSPEGGYNLGSWRRGETRDHTFTKAGVYTQLCRLHPGMVALVVVLDTPYFAKTDKAGAFRIPNIPPGTYTLVAWSEKLKESKQAITVKAAQATTVRVTLSK